MSLLERVIIAHRCRSTHHYIAMDCLPLLAGEDADKWRNLILVHNNELLEGAKAPDAKFKDFKNHVLHVGEGEWGGARDAAMAWYAEAVAHLRDKKWGKAVYAFGVLSHYYADPIQPFHTGQTEEEGAMHRAVEWSIAKSRKTIKARIDEMGYPEIEAGTSVGFVSDMVRAGADKSHVYYQTVLDHYNLDVGVKNPEAGLDQTLIDVFAELIGYATAGLATLFSRAIAESGVKAPKVFISVPGYLATLDIPIRWVTKKLDDERDQRTVAAMYREYKKTGKVIKTLPDDDKLIRKIHARQVLRRPLKELDEQELKPIGQAYTPRPAFAEVANEILAELEPEPEDVIVAEEAEEVLAEADTIEDVEETVDAEEVVEAEPEIIAEVEAESVELEPEDIELDEPGKASKPVIRVAADIVDAESNDEEELTPHEAREFERIEAEEKARRETEREQRFIEERKAREETERLEREERERAEQEARAAEAERLENERLAAEEAERLAREEAEFQAELEAEEARIREAAAKIDTDPEMDASDGEYEFSLEELAAFDTNLTDDGDLPEATLSDASEREPVQSEAPPVESFFDAPQGERRQRSRLQADDPVIDAPSIGKKTARRLNRVGIFNVGDLLSCDPEEIVFELDVRHIDEPTLEDWKAQARLMMDVPGLRVHDAQILVGAGVRSADDLANASATRIFHASMGFLKSSEGSRYLRDDETLEETEVQDWIEMANEAHAA